MASLLFGACVILLKICLSFLSSGMSIDEILEAYPDLEREDLLALQQCCIR
jgi:uncharacterized protein (DUF433 family)